MAGHQDVEMQPQLQIYGLAGEYKYMQMPDVNIFMLW